MSVKGQKCYCPDCKTSRYDTRLYRFTNSSRAPVRFCKPCANKRSDITPAINQKIAK